jgi:GNAT superfamily N-acetyltransferase
MIPGKPVEPQICCNPALWCIDLFKAITRPNFGFDGPMSVDQVRTWIARQGGDGGCFLAFIGGKPVGFAALDFNTQEPDTVVLGVWLLTEVRRKGIGTALAEYALGFARDKGYKRIRGRLPQDNEIALSFLSSIGALVPMYNPEARYELPLG